MAGVHHAVPRKKHNSKNVKSNAVLVPTNNYGMTSYDRAYAEEQNKKKNSNYVELNYQGINLSVDIDRVAKFIMDLQQKESD